MISATKQISYMQNLNLSELPAAMSVVCDETGGKMIDEENSQKTFRNIINNLDAIGKRRSIFWRAFSAQLHHKSQGARPEAASSTPRPKARSKKGARPEAASCI